MEFVLLEFAERVELLGSERGDGHDAISTPPSRVVEILTWLVLALAFWVT